MRTERAAALTLALARTALAGYSAATQSVTHDQALTFNGYLSHPWRDLYFRHDANNHLLSSMLSKILPDSLPDHRSPASGTQRIHSAFWSGLLRAEPSGHEISLVPRG